MAKSATRKAKPRNDHSWRWCVVATALVTPVGKSGVKRSSQDGQRFVERALGTHGGQIRPG
jgi:hypothetical protein